MKKHRAQLIKSCVTLFVLLCCIIFSIGTYSWYAWITKNSTVGIGASVSEDSSMGISEILILKKNRDGHVENIVDNENITLSEYDPLMSGRKFNTPLILVTNITVSSDGASGHLDFHNEIKYANNPWTASKNGSTYLTNFLSNVIEVRSTFCNEIDVKSESNDLDSIYNACKTILDDDEVSNPQTFVQYIENSGNYIVTNKKNVLAFNYLASEFEECVNANGILTVIYQIDYSDILINEFIRLREAANATSSSDILTLNGDLSHIQFKDGVYNE